MILGKDELIRSLQAELQLVKKSLSYRLGRFVTAPLRIIVDSVRAFNQTGSKSWLFKQLLFVFLKNPGKTIRKINPDNIAKLFNALKVENPIQTFQNSARYIYTENNNINNSPSIIVTDEQNKSETTQNNEPEIYISSTHENEEVNLNKSSVESGVITSVPMLSASRILSIIKSMHKNILIAISHDNYLDIVGGVQNLMNKERDDFLLKSVSYIQVYPLTPVVAGDPINGIVLSVCLDKEFLCNITAGEFISLGEMLAKNNLLSYSGIIIHHLLNWSIQVLDQFFGKLKNEKIIFWLHDYFICCPQYNLLRNDYEFCHKPDIESNSCMICAYGEMRKSNSKHVKRFLNNHDFIFLAPSKVVRNIIVSEYPTLKDKIIVSPLVKIIKLNKTRINVLKKLRDPSYKIKIAYLGRPRRYKGWDTWRTFVDSSVSDSYHCMYFSTEIESVKEEHVPINLITKGKASVINLLIDHGVDVVLLWSIWPETFSFTLYEAIAAGCYIITNSVSGNIATYVRENSCGITLESEEELISLLKDPSQLSNLLNTFHQDTVYYAELEPNVETVNLLLNK